MTEPTIDVADRVRADHDAPDLDAVDELCRLALAARRLGCRVQILDVEAPLRELLALAGVDDMIVDHAAGDEPPSRTNRSDLSWPP